MKKWILIIIVLPLLITACKGKKKQLTDETITTADFIDFFEEVKPPYTIADSSFERRIADTVSIPYKTFARMVPDTLLAKQFGKNAHPHIYPLGKMTVKKEDTYLLLKAISPTQKTAYVLVFNKDKKFVAGMLLLVEDNNNSTDQSAVMDSKYSITTNIQHKSADGRLLYKKAAYAYISSAEAFTLILTETNEVEPKKELLNPIDTLPRKNKLAGDYRQDRLNLVSVRDNKKPGMLTFFIHFEKEEGSCKGELKGDAKIVSPGKAVYKQSGDQCELELNFTGNNVSLKEYGCGSHRDIKCFFEGTYTKKPPAKTPGKPTPKTGTKNGSKAAKPTGAIKKT